MTTQPLSAFDNADLTDAETELAPDQPVLKGEYSRNGEFHRNLDPNWNYYPIYLNKVELVDELLRRYNCQGGKILDAGCGEGVLVEKYANQGWDIIGVDKNYTSAYVKEGSLTELPFDTGSFDTVLCLDVMEHLNFREQKLDMIQLKRVLKPGGTAIFSIPNLSHFTSRLKFMFRGRLLRTASIWHHPGDRPLQEYLTLIESRNFRILEKQGIFPTVPPIYRYVMKNPAKSTGLLRFLRKLPFPVAWNFQVLIVAQPLEGDAP